MISLRHCALPVFLWVVTGCAGEPPSTESVGDVQIGPTSSVISESEPLNRIGAALAGKLSDPQFRSWIGNQLGSSPYVEYRVPLKAVLIAGGVGSPADDLLGTAALGPTQAELLSALPDLELYLPIEGQLARWGKGNRSMWPCGSTRGRRTGSLLPRVVRSTCLRTMTREVG